MTQPHLLELAKQGDPHAIATLMNITLEPQGVTAKAFVEVDCLSVFLTAARPLKAKTLATFVQRGILRLEVSSIRQVQVYGQCLGDEQPAWVETFAVDQSPTANALALETLSNVSESDVSRANASEPASVAHSLRDRSTPMETWMRTWIALKPHFEALPWQESLSNAIVTSKQIAARLLRRDRGLQAAPNQEAPNASPSNSRSVNYLKLSALVTLAAFVTGGAVALIANSYTLGGSERKTGGKPATIAAGRQLPIQSDVVRTRDQQQTAARNYLETMNKAQQAFYRQNQRFAATLEELERFAAVSIASRSDYLYKLTVPNGNQSQLTAIPKAEGLKSYTAAVAIAKPSNQVVAAICASQKAAKVPPLVFQSPAGSVQCPVEAAKAL